MAERKRRRRRRRRRKRRRRRTGASSDLRVPASLRFAAAPLAQDLGGNDVGNDRWSHHRRREQNGHATHVR